ncbi:hypothetical protein LTR85_005809 [Meristemomyces frigidus]|nr:hypothetical protein LTR85_005809 [Meristemomyces frigidus]
MARRTIWPLIREESAFVPPADDEGKGLKAGVRAPVVGNGWYLADIEHTLWRHRDLTFLSGGQVNPKLRQRVFMEFIKKEITAMRSSKKLPQQDGQAQYECFGIDPPVTTAEAPRKKAKRSKRFGVCSIAVSFPSGDVHSIYASKLCGGRNEAGPRDAAMGPLEEFVAVLKEQAEEGPISNGTWLGEEQKEWMDITDDKGLRHHLEAQYEADKSGDGLSFEVVLEAPPPEE